MRKKFPRKLPITVEELRELYTTQLLSKSEIAKRLEFTPTSVGRWIKQFGISRTESQETVSLRIPISDEELRCLYVDRLLSHAAISSMYGVKRGSVAGRLRRSGISRTPEQQAAFRVTYSKKKLDSPTWQAAMATGRETKKRKAILNAPNVKTVFNEKVECPDCGQSRVLVHVDRTKPTFGVCKRCSVIRVTKTDSWKAKNLASSRSEYVRQRTRETHSGSKNVNWKGGITSDNQKLRNSVESRAWTKAVMARDGLRCQICQRADSGNLVAHHIKPWSKHKELRFDVDNGMTLCGGRKNPGCHIKVVHRGSWQNDPLTLEEIRTLQYRLATVHWEAA